MPRARTAYYDPAVARRPSLAVWTKIVVAKILFDTTQGDAVAIGVELLDKDGRRRQVAARSEVVLAAGALQSPQIFGAF